jgi:hypothetical protein
MRPAEPDERAVEALSRRRRRLSGRAPEARPFPNSFEKSKPISQTALCAQVGGGAFGSGPSHSPYIRRTWILQRGRGLGLGSCAGYARRNSPRPASRLMGWCGRHGVRAGEIYSIFRRHLVVANEELPLSTGSRALQRPSPAAAHRATAGRRHMLAPFLASRPPSIGHRVARGSQHRVHQ